MATPTGWELKLRERENRFHYVNEEKKREEKYIFEVGVR